MSLRSRGRAIFCEHRHSIDRPRVTGSCLDRTCLSDNKGDAEPMPSIQLVIDMEFGVREPARS